MDSFGHQTYQNRKSFPDTFVIFSLYQRRGTLRNLLVTPQASDKFELQMQDPQECLPPSKGSSSAVTTGHVILDLFHCEVVSFR